MTERNKCVASRVNILDTDTYACSILFYSHMHSMTPSVEGTFILEMKKKRLTENESLVLSHSVSRDVNSVYKL